MSRLARWAFAPLRFLAAIVAAQTALGAVLLLGYVYRRMQNHAIAVWTGAGFESPRWLFAERPDAGFFLRSSGSLWQHLFTGITAWLALAAVVLPGAAAMAVSWFVGWNNSFHKGYEYAAVGPLLGVLGLAASMLALTYLPYAQARHAATGDWRMFFSWRANLQLIGMRPFANLLLPATYTLAGLVVAGARGLLTFAPQIPAFHGLEQDPGGFMSAWFFWWAIPFIVLLFSVKRIGARLYASALLAALDKRVIAHGQLHDAERYYIRGARETTTVANPRHTAATLLRVFWPVLFWFPLFGLLYVQQFVNNVGVWGWLNHPLMLLPGIDF